jgi:precorrin-6A/cobalt-precorrin-6A reductase
VVDATHPFAATISANAALACARTGRPRLCLLRPLWLRHPDDRWHEAADAADAARLLPELGRRALLTLGHRDLAAFAGLDGVRLVVRTIEPPAVPLAALHLTARGPFTLADELALFRAHGIDVLVTKASGGAATYAKIEAARLLGLPVLMLRRPPPPPGETVPAVAPALAWLAAHLAEPSACPDRAAGPKEG